MMLSAKDPEEIITVTFDFTGVAPAPLNPLVTIVPVAGGTDPNPSSMLSGSATISGAKIMQQITGGIVGVNYTLRCRVDTADGSRYTLADVLPVMTAT